MKHSIKRQMIAVFGGLMVCLLLALLVINIQFLEPYYIGNKKAQFLDVYGQLKNAAQDGSIWEESVQTKLEYLAEKNNISYLIMNIEEQEVVTNVHNREMLNNQLMGYLLNQAQKNGRVLETTKQYQITQSMDPRNKTEYIEMWGVEKAGYSFLLRSPLESIKESAAISNRFYIYIGGFLVMICIALIWYFSKRITNPIRELAVLSDRMADLDFNARYESGGADEIGELGANFNRMSDKLQSTISEIKQANNSLLKDIEQKDKLEQMRTEFLGNVSHELKTPLALIQGYAEGLKEGVNSDADSREFYCDVIMDEADKMNQMVKNLLTLNQLEFGEAQVSFERFELTELVQGVLQSMEILAQQKEAKLSLRSDSQVYVWADEFKVEQVIRNYISNAINHVDGDCIVEVKIVRNKGKTRTSVFNTGAPIPDEDLAYVWDKFYKVDKAHTREYGGNGIGLSIVKAIMESFHQEYGVHNYENGVEFWFELDAE